MTYYALIDLQNGEMLHTGRNSTSVTELKEAMRSFIDPDLDPEENFDDLSLDAIIEGWDLKIVYQNQKYKEDK